MSITRAPSGASTHASRTFHSRGNAQSNTCVPVGELHHLEREVPAEHGQRGTDAVSREAARKREQLGHRLVKFAADEIGLGDGAPVDGHRCTAGRDFRGEKDPRRSTGADRHLSGLEVPQ